MATAKPTSRSSMMVTACPSPERIAPVLCHERRDGPMIQQVQVLSRQWSSQPGVPRMGACGPAHGEHFSHSAWRWARARLGRRRMNPALGLAQLTLTA
jgi:hypothetical protein